MNKLKVSFVCSTYNDKNLRESIESLLNQKYDSFEIILVDDAGKENREYIESLVSYKEIILVKHELNVGLTKSLNEALKIAIGDIIVRHDCDDISLPNRLRKVVDFFENNNTDIVSSYAYMNDKSSIIEVPNKLEIPSILPYKNCLIHPALAFKKSIIKKLNRDKVYNESFKYTQDYELYLHGLSNNISFDVIEEPLIIKRFTENTITISKRKQQLLFELAAKSLYLANSDKINIKILFPTLIKLLIPKFLRDLKRKSK